MVFPLIPVKLIICSLFKYNKTSSLIKQDCYIIIMNYNEIGKNIMGIDPNVRFVTIFDTKEEKPVFSEHKSGVTNLLSKDESKESLQLAINAWKTRSKLAPKIGKGKYVLAEYEKIKRITMPLDENHLLYITTEVGCDALNLIDKVKKL